MDQIFDLLFTPVSWTVRYIQNLFGGSSDAESASWVNAGILFAMISVAAFVTLTLAAVLLYELGWWLRQRIEAALKKSCTGGPTDLIAKYAETCVAWETWIGVFTSSLGVRPGVRVGPDVDSRPRGRRAGGAALRGLLMVPMAAKGLIVFVLRWLSSPLGLYLALGIIWFLWRPRLVQALGSIDGVLALVASSSGLALVAVAVATIALALDHGLSPKARSLRAARREMGVRMEGRLVEISDLLPRLTTGIDELVNSFTHRQRLALSRIVKSETNGALEIDGGEVKYVLPKWRAAGAVMPVLRRPSDDTIELHDVVFAVGRAAGTHWLDKREWDSVMAMPKAEQVAPNQSQRRAVRAEFRRLVEHVRRPSRLFLLRIDDGSKDLLKMEADAGEGSARVFREQLRRVLNEMNRRVTEHDAGMARQIYGPILPPNPDNSPRVMRWAAEDIQRLVVEELTQMHDLLWDVLVFRAHAAKFYATQVQRFSPHSFLGRLASRFAG